MPRAQALLRLALLAALPTTLSSCEFGAQQGFLVEHGYPDAQVMATDAPGELLLTSDVDAEQFRVFRTDGTEVDTLPWTVLGYDGELESANGPFNAAATAFDRSGFFVAGGDSVIHWVFAIFGQFTGIEFDEVPAVASGTGRARVCDMSSGRDGSLYVLTSENRDSLDWWARGSAWLHKRSPTGVWSQQNIGLHVFYASALCGLLAHDALNDDLYFIDQVRKSVRVFDSGLNESAGFSLTQAREVRDFTAFAGHIFTAMCESPTCLGDHRMRIFASNGELTDSRGTGRIDAVAIERPPLPIAGDTETGLWTIRGDSSQPLSRYAIEP